MKVRGVLLALALGAHGVLASSGCAQSSRQRAPSTVPAPSSPATPCPQTKASPPKETQSIEHPKLRELVTRFQALKARRWPRYSENPGQHRELERVDPESYASYHRALQEILSAAEDPQGIDPAQLSTNDALTLEVFLYLLRDRIALAPFRKYEIPFTSDSGFYGELTGLHHGFRFDRLESYQNYLAQLADIPRLFDEHIENMRRGLKRGFSAPDVTLASVIDTVATQSERLAEKSPYYLPFLDFPSAIPEATRADLRNQGQQIIAQRILPAYQKLHRFLLQEYKPRARKHLGASLLPQGEAYYKQLIQHYTTLPLEPPAIHNMGLQEVARIRAEMEKIKTEVGYTGSLNRFFGYLRKNPRFFAKSAEELLMRASYIAKKIDAKLPAYFITLPRRTYGVAPVPAAIAPHYTAGRYAPASASSLQPGLYWVNTHDLKSRTLYTLPALTAHEAVPGHHLQITLHQELQSLPEFRRRAGFGAYIEGWALYSELLAEEMGIYSSPYEKFGQLTYEMWRACRLVVDTGIHAMGWSREQAQRYLADNTALSMHEITTEVDRYISWPGQALSYKIGELEIRALRREAQAKLGPDFDIREFHEALLKDGPLPLQLLRRQVERYLQASELRRNALPVVETASANPGL